MAFGGALEDLPIVDVLQLLHATRKSGTLVIEGSKGRASLVFRDGDIISAVHPNSSINSGQILLDGGVITPEQLDRALERQKSAAPGERKPLVAQLLVDGAVKADAATKALSTLVEETIGTIVGWRKGTFELEVAQDAPNDSFRHFPQELGEPISVDAQMMLMNALRILDERRKDHGESLEVEEATDAGDAGELSFGESFARRVETSPAEDLAKETVPAKDMDLSDDDLGLSDLSTLTSVRPEKRVPVLGVKEETKVSVSEEENLLQSFFESNPENLESRLARQVAVIYSSDGYLKHSIRSLLREEGIDVYIYAVEKDLLDRVQEVLARDVMPVLVFDCEQENWVENTSTVLVTELVKRTRMQFPDLPCLFMAPSSGTYGLDVVLALGCRGLIPRPPSNGREEKAEAMRSVFRLLERSLKSIFWERDRAQLEVQFARKQMSILCRQIAQLSDPQLYGDVSMTLLRIVSELLQRAVIFLVREKDLMGMGAFGIKSAAANLALAAIRLKIPLTEGSVAEQVVRRGTVYHGPADSSIVRNLFSNLEEPKQKQILLLPLRTKEQTVAVIYADYGQERALPIQTEALEILARYAGLILEVNLLQRKLSPKPADGAAGEFPTGARLRVVDNQG